jgi:ferredoxin-fold anticodon binding domain-containing protein
MVLIIDDLLMFPISLGMKILRAIGDKVDEEMLNTEQSVRKKIMEIQMLYEGGEIEEGEYRETLKILMDRLKKIKEVST